VSSESVQCALYLCTRCRRHDTRVSYLLYSCLHEMYVTCICSVSERLRAPAGTTDGEGAHERSAPSRVSRASSGRWSRVNRE
jgi:hypothetical protein